MRASGRKTSRRYERAAGASSRQRAARGAIRKLTSGALRDYRPTTSAMIFGISARHLKRKGRSRARDAAFYVLTSRVLREQERMMPNSVPASQASKRLRQLGRAEACEQSGAAYAMDDLARACAIGASSPIHLAGTLANVTYVFARARRPRGSLIAWVDLRLSALPLIIFRGHSSLHSECER